MQHVISAGECTQQKYRSAIYGLVNVLVSESEQLSFYSFSMFRSY